MGVVDGIEDGTADGTADGTEDGTDETDATVGAIIDKEALRKAVRETAEARAARAEAAVTEPGAAAHIEHAKRAYLEVLIDELGGDLALIGRFWDRGSEKTLRKLVRQYGLTGRLEAARGRRSRS